MGGVKIIKIDSELEESLGIKLEVLTDSVAMADPKAMVITNLENTANLEIATLELRTRLQKEKEKDKMTRA